MPVTMSADDRSASVSSMRSTNTPPCRRAYSQLTADDLREPVALSGLRSILLWTLLFGAGPE